MGHSVRKIRKLRSTNVGAELSDAGEISDFINGAVREMGLVGELPPRFRGMLARYVVDMDKVLAEISRVLKKRGDVVLVVGDSTIHNTFTKIPEVSCSWPRGMG